MLPTDKSFILNTRRQRTDDTIKFENQDIGDDQRETAIALIEYQCLNTNGPYRGISTTLGPTTVGGLGIWVRAGIH